MAERRFLGDWRGGLGCARRVMRMRRSRAAVRWWLRSAECGTCSEGCFLKLQRSQTQRAMSETAATRDGDAFVPYALTEKACNSIKAAIASLARAFDEIGQRVSETSVADSQPFATPRKQGRNNGSSSSSTRSANSSLPKQQPHILFQNAWKAGEEAKSLGLKGAELTKAAQLQWKNLPPASKAVWKEKSAALATESAVRTSVKSAQPESKDMEHENALTTGEDVNQAAVENLEQSAVRMNGEPSEYFEALGKLGCEANLYAPSLHQSVSSIATLISDSGKAKEAELATTTLSSASSATSSIAKKDVDMSPIPPLTILPSSAIPRETASTSSKKRVSPEPAPNIAPKKKSPKVPDTPIANTNLSIPAYKKKSTKSSENTSVMPSKPAETVAIKSFKPSETAGAKPSKPATGTGSKKFVPPTLKKSFAAQGAVVDESTLMAVSSSVVAATRFTVMSTGKKTKSEAMIGSVENLVFGQTMGLSGTFAAPREDEAEAVEGVGKAEKGNLSACTIEADAKGCVGDLATATVHELKTEALDVEAFATHPEEEEEGEKLFATSEFVSQKTKHIVEDADDNMAPVAVVLDMEAEGNEMSEDGHGKFVDLTIVPPHNVPNSKKLLLSVCVVANNVFPLGQPVVMQQQDRDTVLLFMVLQLQGLKVTIVMLVTETLVLSTLAPPCTLILTITGQNEDVLLQVDCVSINTIFRIKSICSPATALKRRGPWFGWSRRAGGTVTTPCEPLCNPAFLPDPNEDTINHFLQSAAVWMDLYSQFKERIAGRGRRKKPHPLRVVWSLRLPSAIPYRVNQLKDRTSVHETGSKDHSNNAYNEWLRG
ncbi:hypothetical protein BC830DRAFT_1225350 [Chytriomyces sp. MP71]|nr:hypothetical protein BC830DRAFT_1225350 [Chytriomyces sp. MP71]